MERSMTFGTMPTYEEFVEAWKESDIGESYEITVPYFNADCDVVREVNNRSFTMPFSEGYSRKHGSARATWYYTCEEMYAFLQVCKDLDPSDVSDDLPDDHYPESLASSIMSTLGFEWI